jgi:hypothetical protein
LTKLFFSGDYLVGAISSELAEYFVGRFPRPKFLRRGPHGHATFAFVQNRQLPVTFSSFAELLELFKELN